MKRKNNVKRIINILASRLSLLILGSITIWMGYVAGQEMHERYKVKKEIDRLKEEIISLEKRNNDLSSLIGSFEDPNVIELEAKKRLNLKKPGEEVVVIVRDGQSAEDLNISNNEEGETIAGANSENNENKEINYVSNAIKWWKYIAGN
ncbi:MAG: hypothetical protein A3B96_00515 [Candidatus Spechtbacteria bacterium RIFCSPHIGHO2_02_FULL_43_15b]|uniref:Cell division protein FtsL n=1 Tax=Candidatus Spechtbacteria bacterium RIFCSPHIGHO2_01_FULL_43_30 TaxID=1802158 RepID=A0A1G2H5U9_9BACT|nr:MAG: hypothetical protein A2827_00195 [Candidatus Spechtbacteria bacterium RIFCSPHIGHO2_01_FULL_43_30]OGZ58808.1 MAG: hypothetical protein A3B96_00515 [Candidatus Spechtbacteria bacterium RIFCSPHIGHO2_02_FULL_43_15b]